MISLARVTQVHTRKQGIELGGRPGIHLFYAHENATEPALHLEETRTAPRTPASHLPNASTAVVPGTAPCQHRDIDIAVEPGTAPCHQPAHQAAQPLLATSDIIAGDDTIDAMHHLKHLFHALPLWQVAYSTR